MNIQQTSELTRSEAKELIARITANLSEATKLMAEAYLKRAWEADGYESWEVFCAVIFEGTAFRLDGDSLVEAVEYLKSQGLSTRAAASAVGVPEATVRELGINRSTNQNLIRRYSSGRTSDRSHPALVTSTSHCLAP